MNAERVDIAWIDPGYTSGHFAHSIAMAAAELQYFGAFGRAHRMAASIPAAGRNALVAEFLKFDSEWLWMVDADMVFSHGHPIQLLETAQDMGVKIVSGLAFIWRKQEQPVPSYFLEGDGKFYPTGELHLVENKIPDEPTEVAATGLATSLIHRDVFEAMQPLRDEHYRWFDYPMMPPNQHVMGEDTQFFVRARQLGFDVVLEPRAETWHVKEHGVGRDAFEKYWAIARGAA